MNIEMAKVGKKVVDRWYSNPNWHLPNSSYWGVGVITKITKRRIYIKFEELDKDLAYDYEHFQEFIEKGNYFKGSK